MVNFCGGVNSERETSVKKFHERHPHYVNHAIADVRKVAERAGGMRVRYEARYVNNQMSGKRAFWTFTHSADWIMAKAKEEWGIDPFNSAEVGKKLPVSPSYLNRKAQAQALSSSKPTEDVSGEEITPEGPLKGSEGDGDWRTSLRQLRKDEVEALLEAARQYGKREEFIAEEIKKFADMGIRIDPRGIQFERREDLEVILAIDEYYARVKRANERLTDQLEHTPSTTKSIQTIAALRAEIEELKDERRRREAATEKLVSNYRIRLQDADRRIKLLQGNTRQQSA
jgi:FtsZ-binding cell division protein ZapB